ncbi:cytochrome P450 [Cadophora sp. MPI-SDFR-AT-0126]|nr:cytochrome P450 [Leotiomycetes sp. MPI-SDFR-AT-0126]
MPTRLTAPLTVIWTYLTVQNILILALSSLIGLCIYRLLFHPLRNIPGPFLAKITGHWRNDRTWRGTWHDDILQLHQRYGSVVRIAPNEVSIVHQDSIKTLYGHGSNAMKTHWYAVWDPPIGAPAFFPARDRKLHSFLRKRVSSAYSMTSILKYEQPIQDLLDLMVEKLKLQAKAGNAINLGEWTGALAFDAVGVLGYGAPFEHLQNDAADVMDVRSTILELFFWSQCMGHYWGQMKLLRLIRKLMELAGVEDRIKAFRDWSSEKVKARMTEKKEGIEHPDMLGHFVNMKAQNGGPASFQEVLGEALNLVGAGADTTSIGMRSCIEYVCSKPDVYRKLQEEVDNFYATNTPNKPITYLQTQQLPYLNAVVKEALRLRPSIIGQLLRHTPEGGLVIDGNFIPANTPIGMSPLAQNRDKKVWGDDANEFKPERWLESEAKARQLESYNMTFGGNGPRMCVGRNIALVEIHKFLAQMIRAFDIDIVNKKQPYKMKTYWFSYQHDFMVTLKTRSHLEA